ncbi:hypothetical protein CF319_g8011 [Tilletia indica]|nr:hypothetical protein CF319_g8011 [Tilletia indica]
MSSQSQTSNSPSRGRGRRGRGGRPASVASRASQGYTHTNIAHEAATVTAPDYGRTSIIDEVRAMRNELATRLDGFNERLGEVERWQRDQPDEEDQEDTDGDEQAADIQQHVDPAQRPIQQTTTTSAQGVALFGDRTPPFVTTARPPRVPPHMTQNAPTTPIAAHSLRAQTFTTLAGNGSTPLDRFNDLNSQDKRKVRRAMNKLGLQVPEFMPQTEGEAIVPEGELEDAGNLGDSSKDSPQHQLLESSPTSSTESPIRSSAPATISPAPNIPPAPNIRPGQPLNCKQEFLGKFAGDPSRLEAFLIRVRDVIRSDRESPAWLAAVLRALPIALTDDAAIWHEGLSDAEAAELTSFEAWAKIMRAAFPINEPLQRREARERRWMPSKETASAYQFVKIRLLRQAFGFDQTDHALVTDIVDGFPTSFVAMLHLPRTKPTLQDLRDQIGEWEHRWREMYSTPLLDKHSSSNQSPSTALGRIQHQAMVRSASAPSLPAVSNTSTTATPATRAAQPGFVGMSALAASYDPARVVPAQNGEPRKYKLDGKPTPLRLNRPCSKCQGDHFNFEHDHITAQLRTITFEGDDDYPFDDDTGSSSALHNMSGKQVEVEDESNTQEFIPSSTSTETGLAPSISNEDAPKSEHVASDSAHDPAPESAGTLFLVNRPSLTTPRTLRPNEVVPPLSQPKRAFGTVVTLPKTAATGTGSGYRAHIPLTAHVRINDTDGRAMSTLLDTGATLSCVDASLLRKMGGTPTGTPMKVQGIGSSETLGWATLPVFLHAVDPHGKHVHLEFEQDFHVLPSFPPGLCLGLDFIDAYGVSISPARGRGRIDRYTFQINEKLSGPYAKEPELCVSTETIIDAGSQRWIPVDASCLAPGVDYTVTPRPSITPDETVRLMGPVGLMNHGPQRHILLGNYGSTAFTLEKGTVIADALAARVGDRLSAAGQAFVVGVPSSTPSPTKPPGPHYDPEEIATPLDVFEGVDDPGSALMQDVDVALVDDAFRVGKTSTGEPHPSVVALLRAHTAAFALDGRPGQIEGHDMPITLVPDAVLPPEPPRRASPEKRAAMDAAIEQLLEWDVIEPSQSPVSFPVVMVKQNGKWRFCVDYRQLNSKTIPDRYPLPTIDAIFQTLTGKKWFSSLDAIRGYHQLGVEPEDRWKTAFVCHRGLYQYKRVPFGLRNAPAIFQRMMDKVLGSLRWQQAVVYIDDSVVVTDTLEEHLQALETLLNNAEQIGLKFSPAKCTFAVPSLTLLGRKISGAGVAIWTDRARAVQDLARPSTLQELYHALGLFGYYRAFIPKFAEKAAPLTRLLKGWRYESADGHTRLVNTEGKAVSASRVPLSWGADQQDSFDSLRHAIANPPVLAHPDPSKPYILYTDASKNALAAILHQVTTTVAPASVAEVHARLNTLSVPHLPTPFARDRWAVWLQEDKHFGPIWRRTLASSAPTDEWLVRDGVLIRKSDDRIALPAAGLPAILKTVHDDGGHFGFWRTFLAVSRHFWRPHLSVAVRAWVKHCTPCRQTKAAPKTGTLDITNDPSLPFDHISIDLIYGFPRSRSGNDAALIVQCLFSRMILIEPCHKDITAEGVAAILSDRVLRFGWRPRRVVSDSEARVSGSVMTYLCNSLGAVSTPSSPHHQQANGVERTVQTVHSVLQVMALPSKAHWDSRLIPAVELAINSSPSSVTGQRPFDLIFISHPSVVHAVFDDDEHLGVSSFPERVSAAKERLAEACRHIAVARGEQKRRYDLRRARPPTVVTGMRAWIRLRDRPITGTVADKLDARKAGPYVVEEVLSEHRVRLSLPASMDINPVFSIEQLDFEPPTDDPYAADRPALSPPSAIIRSDDGAALNGRGGDGSTTALVDSPIPPVEDADPDGLEDAALPPRVRRLPASLQDFQLGTVRPAPSPELLDLLQGPLSRPRTIREGDEDLVLTERPIAFLSRLTSPAESRLVAPELELVCLAWAFQKLAHLLEGAVTTVVTDHSPMERMLRSTTPIPYGPTITRCRAVLMPHLQNLRFVYKPGSRHTNADALSRLPIDQGRSSS